ncbi:hypothetical protein QFC22_003773 [Naganishia vaughanmartiniae]|uniref:Uncharacterized protein n=1 Tax=Naganishia vaughanmartiniae TaxID=1424756 RepID=A0ACC2X3G5_9TREE|nr:hypothetical protein QFC22_003773 [Naganishia vaughanmartiniae]
MPSTSKPKAKPRRRRRDDDQGGASESDSPVSAASGSDIDSGSESDAAGHESEESDGSDTEPEVEAEIVEAATLVDSVSQPEEAAEPIETVTFEEFNNQETDPAQHGGNKKTRKDKKQRGVETRTDEPSKSTEDTASPATAQPARPRPASNRAAYLAKIAADPIFVPRVGKFWTHDERHYAAGRVGQGGSEYAGLREMSDYWRERRGRGRGGFGFAPRGGFPVRGRGRGGAVQARASMEQPQQKEEPATAAPDGTAAKESSEQPHLESKQETATDSTPPIIAQITTAQPKTSWNGETGRSDRGSWSHDGYAELAREEERRSEARERQQQMMMARGRGRGMVRGMFRGRGRGRGGFVHPGGVMQPVEQMRVTMAAGTQPSGMEAESSTNTAISITETVQPIVKLPGSESQVPLISSDITNPGNPPISDHEPSAITAHLQTQAEHAERLQQQELKRKQQQSLEADMHRLEIGEQRVDSTGMASSDAGSQGSSALHHSHPPLPNMLPPGIGVTENGGFFDLATGQAVVWVPSPSPMPAHSPMPVGSGGSRMDYNPYTQSAPDMNVGYGYPQPSQAYYGGYPNAYGGYGRPAHPADPMNYASYSPSYMPGRDSPYSMQGYGAPVPPQLGDPSYFMPPRPQSKIEIRAPTSGNPASSRQQQSHSAEIAAATLKDPSKHGAGSPNSIGYSQDNPYTYHPMNGQYDQATRQGYYPQQYMPMGY